MLKYFFFIKDNNFNINQFQRAPKKTYFILQFNYTISPTYRDVKKIRTRGYPRIKPATGRK